MGEAVLEQFPDVAEIRLSMPNKHHFLQDLSAFGLDNPRTCVVYHADDRPYGLIEGTVLRDDVRDRPRSPGRAPPASAEARQPTSIADAAERDDGVDPQVGGVLVVGALDRAVGADAADPRGTATRPASPPARGPPSRPSSRAP